MGYEKYRVDVPEGECGDWKVQRFTVSDTEADWHNIRSLHTSHLRGSRMSAGTYTRLMHGHHIVMSDTDDEVRDHLNAIHAAHGRCLVNGLGLGMVVNAMLMKPGVEHVTVIERAPEVIILVADHYRKRYGDRLEIVEADAFTYKPSKGSRYSVVWHDIWTYAEVANLPEMTKLHRKYGRCCDWQDSWQRRRLRGIRDREGRRL